MATVYWNGNAANVAQVDTLQVTAVAVGGTLSATINGKSVTYTCVAGDTTSTAAAAWQALLAGSDAPPEFQEIDWTVSTTTIIATAATLGMPFTLTKSQGGGATCTLTHVTVSSSESDISLAANWIRGGVAALPVYGDDVIFSKSAVPALWNLDFFATTGFASMSRWNDYTGQIGLPDLNPNGYVEYRPKSFQFIASGAYVTVTLGQGLGSGPTLERYDTLTGWAKLNASSGQDVRFLGTNVSNQLLIAGATVSVATFPAETSAIASATVGNGGTINLGAGCTLSGTLTLDQATANLSCAPGGIVANQGSQVSVDSRDATYVSITASGSSTINWISNSTITTLTLQTGAVFDKSQSADPITIANSTIDGDSCVIRDPMSTITYTNATTVKGQVSSGPLQFQGTRTVKVT